MPTLTDAVNQLVQISRQGFSDTRHLLENVFRVQMGLNPNVLPIPQALPVNAAGGGAGGAGGGGGPSPVQQLGTIIGGLARRFAPRFASHLQTGFQVARLAGSLSQVITGGTAGGGTAAAAGGAGAGGAASGVAAAGGSVLAGMGPVGWAVLAVAAIAAVTVALASLPKAVESFGQSLLDANKNLAQFSASMSAVFLRTQIRDIARNVQIGGGTSASAQRLADALGDLKDTNRALTIAWTNLKNDIGTVLLRLVQPLAKALEGIVLYLEKVGILSKPGPADVLLQNELVDFAREAAQKRAANDARFGRNPFD